MDKRILVVDDEPHVIRVLKLTLEKNGYEVDSAPNGSVALKKIKAQVPDVLVTDIQMPNMSGKELYQYIESLFPERRFLIILMTSRTELDHREWSKDVDNMVFIEKPISIRRLLQIIEDYYRQLAQKSA